MVVAVRVIVGVNVNVLVANGVAVLVATGVTVLVANGVAVGTGVAVRVLVEVATGAVVAVAVAVMVWACAASVQRPEASATKVPTQRLRMRVNSEFRTHLDPTAHKLPEFGRLERTKCANLCPLRHEASSKKPATNGWPEWALLI